MNEHDQPAHRKWPVQNKKRKTSILIRHFRPKISKKYDFSPKMSKNFVFLSENVKKRHILTENIQKFNIQSPKTFIFHQNTHLNGPKMNHLSAARLNFSFKKIILISKIILVIKGQSKTFACNQGQSSNQSHHIQYHSSKILVIFL